MTDGIRRDPLNEPNESNETNQPNQPSEPAPERQGVREPQPIEDTGASGLGSRREFEAADVARENEPRTAHGRGTEPARTATSRASHEDRGLLERVKDAWDRIRH